MLKGLSLQEMLTEVVRQSETKRDYIADTKEHIAMVPMSDFPKGVALVLNRPESHELERFEVLDGFHEQLAGRLNIPKKYYDRLLQDHRDLLLQNVNTLFDREPALRMIRTLDGKARAFLSNQYRRMDNDKILEKVLPVIHDEYETQILSTWVDPDKLKFKALFTGDSHIVDLGTTKTGKPDIVRTGFEMGNSETGRGSHYIRGFLYRDYCLNGCVFGVQDTVSFKQIHVGSKLGITKGMLLSEDTMRKEDELIVSAAQDVLRELSSPEFARKVETRLQAMRSTAEAKDAHATVESVCKELKVSENDTKSVLESFIKDRDYTQWGMLNAITEQANTADSYDKACAFEELGNKIINLPANRWAKFANLERVAA